MSVMVRVQLISWRWLLLQLCLAIDVSTLMFYVLINILVGAYFPLPVLYQTMLPATEHLRLFFRAVTNDYFVVDQLIIFSISLDLSLGIKCKVIKSDHTSFSILDGGNHACRDHPFPFLESHKNTASETRDLKVELLRPKHRFSL